jgi:hypothetical protein
LGGVNLSDPDTDVARRPHGHHTTVVVHLDLETRIAALHLGPVLPDADRRAHHRGQITLTGTAHHLTVTTTPADT